MGKGVIHLCAYLYAEYFIKAVRFLIPHSQRTLAHTRAFGWIGVSFGECRHERAALRPSPPYTVSTAILIRSGSEGTSITRARRCCSILRVTRCCPRILLTELEICTHLSALLTVLGSLRNSFWLCRTGQP